MCFPLSFSQLVFIEGNHPMQTTQIAQHPHPTIPTQAQIGMAGAILGFFVILSLLKSGWEILTNR
jgi:hypothetical protein